MNHHSRVLIVNDDPVECLNLEDLLSIDGYHLMRAANGLEALAMIADFRPDLVLLDVMMPGIDGFEVCRRLRADPETAELPIILVTSLDDRRSRLRGLEAGADDFISKPFDTMEMQARVRTITRLNRYHRLLAERKKFEHVVEHTEAGYVLLNRRDQILFANPKARLYLGAAGDEDMTRRHFLPMISRQYQLRPDKAWQIWPVEPSQSSTTRYLVRPETPTSQAFWLELEVIDDLAVGPEPIWIVRLSDVTEQVQSQQLMRKISSSISHKLRTPLTGVVGSLELLANETKKAWTPETTEMLEMALESVNRLQDEVTAVVRLSEMPTLAQTPDGFSLNLLPPMLAALKKELGLDSMSVTLAQETSESNVPLSADAVEQLLRELLINARKFHPRQQPQIEVVVSLAVDETISICVRDDGLTLSPQQLEQAWQPYFQGEKYYTGQVVGMGLGLPMVATMVWGIGGRCWIRNRPDGPGVVVELLLPVMKRPSK